MSEKEFERIKFNINTLIEYKYNNEMIPVLCSVSSVNFTEIIIELIPIDDPYHKSEKFYANIKHCSLYKKLPKNIINIKNYKL